MPRSSGRTPSRRRSRIMLSGSTERLPSSPAAGGRRERRATSTSGPTVCRPLRALEEEPARRLAERIQAGQRGAERELERSRDGTQRSSVASTSTEKTSTGSAGTWSSRASTSTASSSAHDAVSAGSTSERCGRRRAARARRALSAAGRHPSCRAREEAAAVWRRGRFTVLLRLAGRARGAGCPPEGVGGRASALDRRARFL
jgi:hypothetical protein